MIAASVLFLAAAIATFLVGVFSSGLQMIGVSIGCSVAAAVLLLVGVMRDAKRRPVVASPGLTVPERDVATYAAPSLPEEPATSSLYDEPATESYETPALATASAYEEQEEEPAEDFFAERAESFEDTSYDFEPLPEIETAKRARKPATRAKSAAKKTAARKPAARKPAAKTTAAKTAAKKPAVKKAAAKKTTAKKPAAKKTTAKKTTAKKAAPRRSSSES